MARSEKRAPFLAFIVRAICIVASQFNQRVFALYKNLFGKEQQALLEDYKETAVMMRYNENQRYKDRQNVYVIV